MLGDRFPSGVFDGPPREWVQSYNERKKRVAASREHREEPPAKRQAKEVEGKLKKFCFDLNEITGNLDELIWIFFESKGHLEDTHVI